MKKRCYNPGAINWHLYGGRGISVCEAWRNSFKQFKSDMGDYPTEKHEIDRIDTNGNYTPDNCRWVTRAENCHNTRFNKLSWSTVREIRSLLYQGATQMDLAARFSVHQGTISKVKLGLIWKEV